MHAQTERALLDAQRIAIATATLAEEAQGADEPVSTDTVRRLWEAVGHAQRAVRALQGTTFRRTEFDAGEPE